jgi:hypothetical protein
MYVEIDRPAVVLTPTGGYEEYEDRLQPTGERRERIEPNEQESAGDNYRC